MARRGGSTKEDGATGRPTLRNSRARHQFDILETHEAGIVLVGTEVKSIRAGQAALDDSYARFRGDELFLFQMRIEQYDQRGYAGHEPMRPRKLLMHRRELNALKSAVERKGLTLVPLELRFSERNLAKVVVALARGRKTVDKRERSKERIARREMDRHRGR